MNLPKGFTHGVQVGCGASSTVYRAQQDKLDREVALKVITCTSKVSREKVVQEAHLHASVQSGSVPKLFDIIQEKSKVVLVLEWIRGVPLAYLNRYDVSDGGYRAIAKTIISAVARLHAEGVSHRDLKPENVIITPDRGVVLVDFGFSHNERSAGVVLSLKGTPTYMAPELWDGEATVDFKRADLYALGMLLSKMPELENEPLLEVLLRKNPVQRPDDGAAFEKLWAEETVPSVTTFLEQEIIAATSHYVATMLFEGVRVLSGHGNLQEAYALLTESLAEWPDFPEALEFLQTRFSTPPQKNVFWGGWAKGAGVAGVLLLLAGAYFAGRHTPAVPVISTTANRWLLPERIRGVGSAGSNVPASKQILLRELNEPDRLEGDLIIRLPYRKGTLFIDGVTAGVIDGVVHSVSLSAGTHRIEWADATIKRRVGETVDILAFASRMISFERYDYEG